VFPHNITAVPGTAAGLIMSMGHGHAEEATAQAWDDATTASGYGVGIMYSVIFNSGKNTTGLNSHFSQNHVDHTP